MSEVKAVEAVEVAPVQGSGTFTWSIQLFEQRGTCWISWSTNAPFRASGGKVCLYPGSFPPDPQNATTWQWDDQPSPFDTKQPWGAGWCAARIAQQGVGANYAYVYFVQTPVTQS
jgi:hypothetical protein